MKKAFIFYGIFTAVTLFSTILLTCIACNARREETKYLNHYGIEARLEESGVLYGTMEFIYYNQTDTILEFLDFNLFGNAFRQEAKYKPVEESYTHLAYYAGKSYGGMQIESVQNCKSFSIVGEDENILRVHLSTPLEIKQSVCIVIEYTLQLAKVNHRTGITEKAINLGNFYPIVCVYENGKGFFACNYYSNGDPFYSEVANYTVKLHLPDCYVAASSGECLQKTSALGQNIYQYSLSSARDFAIVLSKNFMLQNKDLHGIQLQYYYYRDENPQKTLTLIADCMEYFTKSFGDYQYTTYSVVQTGFCYGGMEYPALSMISDSLTERDYLYTIVHETAHQWWYSAVGNNEITEAWLDEGLTEYSTALFFKNYATYAISYTELIENARMVYRTFYQLNAQLSGSVDSSLNRSIDAYGQIEYYLLNYVKGMLLYDNLSTVIGEKGVYKSLQKYYQQNMHKIATKASLQAAFSKRGQNIIESFVNGSVVI